MKITALSTVLLLAALTGCARHSYQASISVMGQYEKVAVHMDWEDGRDVRVYFPELPEGISIQDNQLIVDKERYDWLTLGVWTFFVPLYYPCFVVKGESVNALADDRERRINELKNITKAAGGNLLIFTSQVSDTVPKAYAIKAR